MERYQKIYERNKRLDDIFIEKYESQEPLYFEKNCLEFLVELGEFANETKCFKYWSVKKPNHDEVLEEFADCITMILYFFNTLNLELDNFEEHQKSSNVLEIFNYLYQQGTKLMTKLNEKLVKDIFINLLYLAELFDLKEEEIITAISKKQDKIEERLNSDY